MRNVDYNKPRVVKYLLWTFALAYIIQIGAGYLYNNGNAAIGQMVVAAMMYVPALSVLLSGAGQKALGSKDKEWKDKEWKGKECKGREWESKRWKDAVWKDMGWKPQIRKNIKIILIAWFSPVILTAIGTALYFLIFPGHFDLSGEYVIASVGAEALEQMKAQGVSYPVSILISVVGSTTYAPLINMFLALGEEIAWRGFLYPQLKARFGRKKGWLVGGIIWGAWHWPLIWLIGYEYGAAAGNAAGYAGFPVSGMLLFCVITIGWGILHDRLYEDSGSIWVPAIFHGAINAAATLPLAVCITNTGTARLLGPAPMGIIAGLPFLIVAAMQLLKKDK